MLSISSYSQDYVDKCRAQVARQLSTYRDLASAARSQAATGGTPLDSALEAFEPQFFDAMVLALDHLFDHRQRALEKKDGNALNEVRILCSSLMSNDGRLAADTAIRLDPAKSVLHLRVGDEIALREQEFLSLSDAFFIEIERRYPAAG